MNAVTRELAQALASSAAMRAIYSDHNLIASMLSFEASLAASQAELDVIPTPAAQVIHGVCEEASWIDLDALGLAAPAAGNLAIPLVKQLTAAVAAKEQSAAAFVHWGATSQDVIDTGAMLQAQQGLRCLIDSLDRTNAQLAQFADAHRGLAMAGRTWLQHATPVSAGLKAAGWLQSLVEVRQRLLAVDADLPLQFGGASGTLAALGPAGDALSDSLALRLGLRRPPLPWHAARRPMIDLASALGLLVGTFGKIARDLSLLMQNEVAEMSEPKSKGKGGSSTMAHKRNPVGCAVALAAAVRAPALVAAMYAGMVQEHERGLGGWQAEWTLIPELFLCASGATEAMEGALGALSVDADAMARHLAMNHGVAMAEAATFGLSEKLGRQRAQTLVEQAIERTRDATGPNLATALWALPEVQQSISQEALLSLLAPEHYLGSANAMIDRVLLSHRNAKPGH
jgi:3-carboxy-cis,cis-muconate cycloisomerase